MMIRTQIQIPDHLYREAKRIAQQYEMSFAEVVRRGLERVVGSYPDRPQPDEEWSLPMLDTDLRLPLEALKDIAADDEELRSQGTEIRGDHTR